jgi:uncharacterized membrane protein YjdF
MSSLALSLSSTTELIKDWVDATAANGDHWIAFLGETQGSREG